MVCLKVSLIRLTFIPLEEVRGQSLIWAPAAELNGTLNAIPRSAWQNVEHRALPVICLGGIEESLQF